MLVLSDSDGDCATRELIENRLKEWIGEIETQYGIVHATATVLYDADMQIEDLIEITFKQGWSLVTMSTSILTSPSTGCPDLVYTCAFMNSGAI